MYNGSTNVKNMTDKIEMLEKVAEASKQEAAIA
jgi:hypothetical protein